MLSPLNISDTRPGDAATAPALRVVFEETLQPFFELSLEGVVPYVLANQATIARLRGDHAAAHRLLDEARGLFERAEDQRGLAAVLVGRAYLELAAGVDGPGTGVPRAGPGDTERTERPPRSRDGDGRVSGWWESTAASSSWPSGSWVRRASCSAAPGTGGGSSARCGVRPSSSWPAGARRRRTRLLRERVPWSDTTERRGWIDVTIAMQAEVAAVRGEQARAGALFEQAREGYLAAGDEAGAAAVEQHAQMHSKTVQSRRKAAAS